MIHRIVILSGKGGTGKTVLAASLASLVQPVVAVDADVDTPNLAFLLRPSVVSREKFFAGLRPVRDEESCERCGACRDHCRFDAIRADFTVDDASCEGCGLCARVCPAGARRMVPQLAGEVRESRLPAGYFVDARLVPGAESCGKVVARVLKLGTQRAESEGVPVVIADGPPGIGCPAIACVSAADEVIVVTEPGLAGSHDLWRLLDLVEGFSVPVSVVINRFDLAPDQAEEIEEECARRGIPVAGRIPFDRKVVADVVRGVPPIEDREGPAARAIRDLAERWVEGREGRVSA